MAGQRPSCSLRHPPQSILGGGAETRGAWVQGLERTRPAQDGRMRGRVRAKFAWKRVPSQPFPIPLPSGLPEMGPRPSGDAGLPLWVGKAGKSLGQSPRVMERRPGGPLAHCWDLRLRTGGIFSGSHWGAARWLSCEPPNDTSGPSSEMEPSLEELLGGDRWEVEPQPEEAGRGEEDAGPAGRRGLRTFSSTLLANSSCRSCSWCTATASVYASVSRFSWRPKGGQRRVSPRPRLQSWSPLGPASPGPGCSPAGEPLGVSWGPTPPGWAPGSSGRCPPAAHSPERGGGSTGCGQ